MALGPIPRRGREGACAANAARAVPASETMPISARDRRADLVRVYVYLDHGLVPARERVALGGNLAQPAADDQDEVCLFQGLQGLLRRTEREVSQVVRMLVREHVLPAEGRVYAGTPRLCKGDQSSPGRPAPRRPRSRQDGERRRAGLRRSGHPAAQGQSGAGAARGPLGHRGPPRRARPLAARA